MALKRLPFFLVIFAILALSPQARADWINLTGAQSAPNIAEIYVEDGHVRLVLEIYVKDLDKFKKSTLLRFSGRRPKSSPVSDSITAKSGSRSE